MAQKVFSGQAEKKKKKYLLLKLGIKTGSSFSEETSMRSVDKGSENVFRRSQKVPELSGT